MTGVHGSVGVSPSMTRMRAGRPRSCLVLWMLFCGLATLGAELQTSISSVEVTTADTLIVRVDAEWARDEEMPVLPKPYGSVGEFIVRQVTELPRKLSDDGETLTTGVVIELLPPLPGTYELPGYSVGGEPVMIEVSSFLPAETADLKLKAPAEKRGGIAPSLLVVGVLGLLLLLYVLFVLGVLCATGIWLWQRKKTAAENDPIARAEAELVKGTDPAEVARTLESGGHEAPKKVAELLDHVRYAREPAVEQSELRAAVAGWIKEVAS